jgi:RNA polymerase sigma factor (sigma-70 family)
MDTTRISLLARLKDLDNSGAWEEFDQIYRPMLHRFVRACGLNGAAGEDVVQECMASVAQHIGRFEHEPGRGAFRAWLRTMVVNRVLNLRRGAREVQAGSEDLRVLITDEPGPEETFDRICREDFLQYCLKDVRRDLEPSTFEAFQRHVLDEAPVDEVCRVLGMTPNQIYKIKWRVTRKIAERLKELDF